MAKKTTTIKLKQGSTTIDYAKVSSRLSKFIEEHKNATISTRYEFVQDHVVFSATLYPDCNNQNHYFTGTSMGKINATKAFEKLETIAVGRALAFAGYLSNGEIASSEEMEVYYDEKPSIDVSEALLKLEGASSLNELQKVWKALTQAERNDLSVQHKKDQMKKVLEELATPIVHPEETK